MNPGQGVNQAGTGPGAASVAPGGQPVGPVTPELSPAEQLKAMAQQCAKRLHQKQQQAANWSPAGAPTSPYNSGPFNQDKPNSPMMYAPQAFNTPQGPLVSGMAPNNGPKAPMNNYLPHNHMGMMGQQQPNSINQNALSKQQQQQQQTAAMLSYNNTKPLTHFTGSGVDHMGQRMTPPMGGNSQVKNPMMTPYMSGAGGGGQGAGPCPTQGPIPGQTAHPSEDHKRIMMMKQKPMNQTIPYSSMQHAQVWKLLCGIDSYRCCRFFEYETIVGSIGCDFRGAQVCLAGPVEARMATSRDVVTMERTTVVCMDDAVVWCPYATF
uniref:Uncharacterized protein n=1 Tax=Oryzias latipes TaxID=8090 RepID=A0A3B3H7W1_ORYLA